jgi:hypothetical protein
MSGINRTIIQKDNSPPAGGGCFKKGWISINIRLLWSQALFTKVKLNIQTESA